MRADLKAIGDAVVETVKSHVASALAEISKRLDALDSRLNAVPTYNESEIALKAAEKALAVLPIPKDGVDGKDADPALIAELVAKAVEAIPKPRDGTSVSIDDVLPIISSEAAKAAASIRVPNDGKDADMDLLRAELKEMVGAIPKPQDGKSVDQAEVVSLVEAETAKAFASLPKPKDGESVPIAQVQKMIDDAVSKAVSQIRPPRDGEPGRDAAHIEVLPAIETVKSYPRGTYAKHAGGLWRAFEATHGMRGWECIVEGVAGIDMPEDQDPRKTVIGVTLSSGARVEKRVHLPVMVYRGVFKDGSEYVPGDTVTFGGSLWHCNAETKEKPKEHESGAWQLAAKRGRDGRDLTKD